MFILYQAPSIIITRRVDTALFIVIYIFADTVLKMPLASTEGRFEHYLCLYSRYFNMIQAYYTYPSPPCSVHMLTVPYQVSCSCFQPFCRIESFIWPSSFLGQGYSTSWDNSLFLQIVKLLCFRLRPCIAIWISPLSFCTTLSTSTDYRSSLQDCRLCNFFTL